MKATTPIGFATLFSAAVLAWSPPAKAADANGFGSQTQLIITADRLFPLFSFVSVSSEPDDNTSTTQTASSLSFLWGNSGFLTNPHTVPRVAFDVSIGSTHLTLGGAFVANLGLGGSTTTESTAGGQTRTTEVDSAKTTVVGFAPRVGYILPLGDLFAFWPRLGFAFYSVSTREPERDNNQDITVTNSSKFFSLDIDPQFAIVPLEHFFFHAGPLLNIPLSGSVKREAEAPGVTQSVSTDFTFWHFGMTAGIGGWFNL